MLPIHPECRASPPRGGKIVNIVINDKYLVNVVSANFDMMHSCRNEPDGAIHFKQDLAKRPNPVTNISVHIIKMMLRASA